jgi:histidine ammonia-lyase
VIGIELLAATQGLDFHAPLKTSARLDATVAEIRSHVPHYAADRYLGDDLAWAKSAVLEGLLSADVEAELFQPSSPPRSG